jgi:hypothetical protein
MLSLAVATITSCMRAILSKRSCKLTNLKPTPSIHIAFAPMRRVLHECIVLLHYITLLHVLASIGVVARKLCPICGNGFKLLFSVLLRKNVFLSVCFRSFMFVLVSIILEALHVQALCSCIAPGRTGATTTLDFFHETADVLCVSDNSVCRFLHHRFSERRPVPRRPHDALGFLPARDGKYHVLRCKMYSTVRGTV